MISSTDTDASSSSGDMESLGEQEAKVIGSQADMVKALGQYIENVAHAHAVDVAAEGDAVVVNMKKIDLNMLKQMYHRLLVAQHNADLEMVAIRRMDNLLNHVYRWEHIDPGKVNNWQQGWLYFYQRAGKIGHDALALVVCSPEARKAENFVHPVALSTHVIDHTGTSKTPEQVWKEKNRNAENQAALDEVLERMRKRDEERINYVVQDAPDSVDNVIELVSWLYLVHCIPKAGSAASFVVTAAVDVLSAVATAKIQQVEDAFDKMRKGTFQDFDPMKIADLKVNQALEGSK